MVHAGSVYHITNAQSGTALDQSGTDNVSIIGWPSHTGDNQKWHIDRVGNGYFLRNVRSNKYIGLANNNIRDDVRAVAVDYQHEWDIRADEEDDTVYRIYVPGHDHKFNLDLTGFGNAEPGTPVAIWGKWNGKNQCWRLQQL